jgi:hypothetical protein
MRRCQLAVVADEGEQLRGVGRTYLANDCRGREQVHDTSTSISVRLPCIRIPRAKQGAKVPEFWPELAKLQILQHFLAHKVLG